MFTEKEFIELFWVLFDVLPEDVKNMTKDRWRQIGPDIPFIATEPDHIIVYQPFNYGMTNIVAIML